MKGSNKNGKILVYALLIFGSLIMIFPFVWMFLTSFKTPAESMSIPATFFPSAFRLDKYIEVLGKLPFAKLYWNTILLVFFRVVCAVVFSSGARACCLPSCLCRCPCPPKSS